MISPPQIEKKFVCITNREEQALAAVAASYLFKSSNYPVFFEFPNVSSENHDEQLDLLDIHLMSRNRAHVFDVRIFNSIQKINTKCVIILIGLSKEQKSFLSFLDNHLVIEISDLDSITTLLSEFTENFNFLTCRTDQLCLGLICAIKENKLLLIDDDSRDINVSDKEEFTDNLFVIEESNSTTPVLAICLAISCNVDIKFISPPEVNKHEINRLIIDWKENGNEQALLDLSSLVFNQLEGIPFNEYASVTFFTKGFPYSLILKNCIPVAHVSTEWSPDFFIVNNILNHVQSAFYSAVVFSPDQFNSKEETKFIVSILENNNYYVKKILGKNATVDELDNSIREYPYEILHVCSHGGQIDGFRYKLKFKDKRSVFHEIIYDEIVSFAPSKIEEKIGVQTKWIWRIFDGLPWNSKELKDLDPQVFVDMIKAVRSVKKRKGGTRIKNISDSCSIKCSDFSYQGMFNSIAGHRNYPLVFNNSCTSWVNINESFIYNGCSTYIGTIWNVDNDIAKDFAESFYLLAQGDSLLNAFYNSLSKLNGSDHQDIYIIWGLPFTILKSGNSIIDSRFKVAHHLLKGIEYRKIKNSKYNQERKEQNMRLIHWAKKEIQSNLQLEELYIRRGNFKF